MKITAILVILAQAAAGQRGCEPTTAEDLTRPRDGGVASGRDGGPPSAPWRGDPFEDVDPSTAGDQPASLNCRVYFDAWDDGQVEGFRVINGFEEPVEIVADHPGLRYSRVRGSGPVSCWHDPLPDDWLGDPYVGCRPAYVDPRTGEMATWAAAQDVPPIYWPGTDSRIPGGIGVCAARPVDGGSIIELACWPQANIDIQIVPRVDGSILWVFGRFGELARSSICPGWNRYLVR